MKKRLLCLFSCVMILVVLFCSTFMSVSAYVYDFEGEYGGEIRSASVLFKSLDTGEVLYEKDADTKRYPASTTKIMTYIITVENVEDIENTRVEIKQDIISMLDGTESSMAGLQNKIGETVSVIDLLYCLMLPSGNDAALVLADYVGGGSIENFVDMMNAKAEELGCENTHFVNPHGLHDDDHYTTARDLMKISEYALNTYMFKEVTSTATYYCEGDDYPIYTTNNLIDENRGEDQYYPYAVCGKTGFTDQAGKCLVQTAEKDGYSYILVAMYDDPFSGITGTVLDAINLFNWAFDTFEMRTVADTDVPICNEKILYSSGKDSILLIPESNFVTLMPTDTKDTDIEIVPQFEKPLQAPVNKGDVVGTALIKYRGDDYATINLVATESVQRSDLKFFLGTFGNLVLSPWFIIIAVVFVCLLLVYIIVVKTLSDRNNAKVKKYRDFK